MTADFPVVLDACVLVPASLRDTLLGCAERRMYLPRWSNEILDELRRTLLEKLGRSPEQVDHLLAELNRHFADARVEGFETLVALMTNDPGDRHVIAAAVKCGAEATYLGVERTLFYFVCVGAVGAFNLFNSILAGIAVFIGGFAFGHWVTNSDPAFLRILAKSERYKLRYDAAKQQVPRVEVV
jgi:type IV secretory pathway TrbD component